MHLQAHVMVSNYTFKIFPNPHALAATKLPDVLLKRFEKEQNGFVRGTETRP